MKQYCPLLLLMEEIPHQLVGSLSQYLQGFSTIPGGCLGFLPSTNTAWLFSRGGGFQTVRQRMVRCLAWQSTTGSMAFSKVVLRLLLVYPKEHTIHHNNRKLHGISMTYRKSFVYPSKKRSPFFWVSYYKWDKSAMKYVWNTVFHETMPSETSLDKVILCFVSSLLYWNQASNLYFPMLTWIMFFFKGISKTSTICWLFNHLPNKKLSVTDTGMAL